MAHAKWKYSNESGDNAIFIFSNYLVFLKVLIRPCAYKPPKKYYTI